jgi:hypothetical protein
MAWHKLTRVVELITKELSFPWQVNLAQLAYNKGLNGPPEWTPHVGVQGENEDVQDADDWVLPLASDDLLPLGFGNPVNLRTYTVRTPSQVWDFMEEITKGTKVQIVSSGTVQNRSKFFIANKLVELESVKIADGSQIELIANFIGSLDKSIKQQMVVSGIRTVCYNTLMMNFLLKGENSWQYRHTKNMQSSIDADKPLIERVMGLSAVVKATFDQLVTQPCTVDRAAAIYCGFLSRPKGNDEDAWPVEVSSRSRNIIEAHVDAFRRGDGNNGKTEFDLLNGWTQLRTRGYEDSTKDKFETFETSEFGSYKEDKKLFAEMLTTKRPRLALIEAKGAELIKTV